MDTGNSTIEGKKYDHKIVHYARNDSPSPVESCILRRVKSKPNENGREEGGEAGGLLHISVD
jgi:hypothetical protein